MQASEALESEARDSVQPFYCVSPDGRLGLLLDARGDASLLTVGARIDSGRLSDGGDGGLFDWSPRGDRLLSHSSDGTVRIWSSQHGECLAVLECGYEVSSARWSPDGDAIAVMLLSGEVMIWDARHER
jgi:WD40 repeat protein